MADTNYSSGDDYIVEFLGYRFTFNACDFEQRVVAAAAKLGLVQANELDEDETADLVALAAQGVIDEPRLASGPLPRAQLGARVAARTGSRSSTGCASSSSAAPGSTIRSSAARSRSSGTTARRSSPTSTRAGGGRCSSSPRSPPGTSSSSRAERARAARSAAGSERRRAPSPAALGARLARAASRRPISPACLAADHFASRGEQLALGVADLGRARRGARPRFRRERAAQVLGVVAFATVAEFTGSILWGVYRYRLHNLPLFIPPAHGLVFLAGSSLSPRPRPLRAPLVVAAAAARRSGRCSG